MKDYLGEAMKVINNLPNEEKIRLLIKTELLIYRQSIINKNSNLDETAENIIKIIKENE